MCTTKWRLIVKIYLTLAFINSFWCINGQNNTNNNFTISWIKLESFTNRLIANQVKAYENDIKSILQQSNITTNCSTTINSHFDNLTKLKHDAFAIADASGGWPTGIMSGNVYSYGSYEQCLSLESSQYCVIKLIVSLPPARKYEGFTIKLNQSVNPFKTETFNYLMSKLHFLRITNITYGLCMPRGCDLNEVKSILSIASSHFETGLTIDVRNCDVKIISPTFDSFASISLAIVGLVIAVNLIATYGHVSCLQAFNMKANYRSLIKPSSSTVFTSLEGIKAISMALIIMAHIFATQMEEFTVSIFKIEQLLQDPSLFLSNFFPFAVDIFFLVTGIKAMQLMIKQNNRPPNIIMYTLTRYINFLPIVAWSICIQFILSSDPIKATIGGPNWPVFKANDYDICRNNWLMNFLILGAWFSWETNGWSNFETCILTDWYLSVDLVFALITGLVWIPYSRGMKKLALFAIWLLIFFGIIASGLTINLFDLRTFWRITDFLDAEARRFNVLFHLKPIAHLSTYFIGVFVGYWLINNSKSLSRKLITFGWLTWIALIVVKVYFFYYDPESNYLPLFIYGTFSKTIWSLLVAWLIVNIEKVSTFSKWKTFLSSQSMQIVSRLSLALMCLNVVIFKWKNAITHNPSNTNPFKFIFIEYLPFIVIIYLLAFVSTIIICYPTGKLLKLFFLGKPKESHKKRNENDDDLNGKNGAELATIKVNDSSNLGN